MAKKRAAEIKRLAESLSTKPEEMPPPPVPKKTRKAKADPPVPPEKSDESEKPQKKRKTPSKAIDGDAPKDGGWLPVKTRMPSRAPSRCPEVKKENWKGVENLPVKTRMPSRAPSRCPEVKKEIENALQFLR